PTPEELAQAAYEQCKSEKGASACYSECKSANSATCTLANGQEVQKAGDNYVQFQETTSNYSDANKACTSKGMKLISFDQAKNLYEKDKALFDKNAPQGMASDWDLGIWVSDEFTGGYDTSSGTPVYYEPGSCGVYISQETIDSSFTNKNSFHIIGTREHSVWCVAE
ncbi:hypothetical protein IJV79_04620, partial [bacterium]|nr:hypothetical protein [bacterium]